MFKHNLTPVLNLQRADKRGLYPLRIRATIKRKVTYYPTGIMLDKTQWDKQENKIILHPTKTLLQATLAKKMADIEAQFVEQSLAGNDSLVIEKKVTKDFIKYVEGKIEKNKPLRKPSTTIQLLSALNKFKGFRAKLTFTEINANLLHDYEDYCRSLTNSQNTVWSSIKFCKTFIHEALHDGIIKTNPILNFKGTKYKDPERDYLTAEELQRIEKVATKETILPQYRNAANWFLFCCYTGLRYSDAFAFTTNKIVDKRIVLRTQKTGSNVSIALHPKLQIVINRLGDNLTSNQDYNRNLKAVAALAKINKPITSHIARYSFAVHFLDYGGSMEVLSKLLAHTNLRTTQLYGKITDLKVDAEMGKVWGK